MKKRTAGLLAGTLCLVMLLGGCGLNQEKKVTILKKTTPTPTPAASAQADNANSGSAEALTATSAAKELTVKEMEGVYVGESGKKGVIRLMAKDEKVARILIDWPDTTQGNPHWEMTGAYDAEKKQFVYSDARMSRTFTKSGKRNTEVVYTEGAGSISVDGRRLIWNDAQAATVVPQNLFVYEMPLEMYRQTSEAVTIVPTAVTPTPTQTPLNASAVTPSPSPLSSDQVTPTEAPAPTAEPTKTPVVTAEPTPVLTETPEPAPELTPEPTVEPELTVEPEPTEEPSGISQEEPYGGTAEPSQQEEAHGEMPEEYSGNETDTSGDQSGNMDEDSILSPEDSAGDTTEESPEHAAAEGAWLEAGSLGDAAFLAGMEFDVSEWSLVPDGMDPVMAYQYQETGAVRVIMEDPEQDTCLTIAKADADSGLTAWEIAGEFGDSERQWSDDTDEPVLYYGGSGDTVSICTFETEEAVFAVTYIDREDETGLTPEAMGRIVSVLCGRDVTVQKTESAADSDETVGSEAAADTETAADGTADADGDSSTEYSGTADADGDSGTEYSGTENPEAFPEGYADSYDAGAPDTDPEEGTGETQQTDTP